jgi:hypothetical protein
VTSNEIAICQLSDIYEKYFYFVDLNNKKVNNFKLTKDIFFTYGLVLDPKNDFNMLYSLICVKNDFSKHSPKVAFIIGANKQADPNISIINYYGACGNWTTVPGIGENFIIHF